MSPKVLLFGAGGALGAAIATHLSGEGCAVYTAGTTHWDGAIAHLALGYGDPCDAASFSSLPDLDAVVWAQGLNCSDTVTTYETENLQRLLQGNVLFIAASLQALVALPGLGRVYRTRTVRNGELVVISEFSDLAGGALRVSQRLGQGRIEATRLLPAETQLVCCQTPDGRNRLLLEPETGHLLGLELDQGWPQLSELMGLLLRDEFLSPLQRQAFEANGQLLLETPEQRVEAGSQLVCACTGTSGTQLREIARQCATLAELQRRSAAGTVCGGCLNRLPLFLSQPPQARLCRLRTSPLAGEVRS